MYKSNFSTAFGLWRLGTADPGLGYPIERIDFTGLQREFR
jgi:hypothetical protein